MITQRDFDEITSRKRNKMAARLRPKYWKKGKRAGRLRVPGFELPFTLDEFRAWAMQQIGFQAVRCHYCPAAIDILSFEPDHSVPLALGGSPGLENLVASCEDCNRLKGEMLPDDFTKLMRFLEDEISYMSAADIKKRLRSGAMANRLKGKLAAMEAATAAAGQQPQAKPPQPVRLPAMQRELLDDF